MALRGCLRVRYGDHADVTMRAENERFGKTQGVLSNNSEAHTEKGLNSVADVDALQDLMRAVNRGESAA